MHISKALMLIGVLGLAACTNPDRYGAGGADGAGGYGPGGGAGGIGVDGLGSASDPNSPAYFNQTIGNTVNFLVDQHTLSPQAQEILARQAQWLSERPTYMVLIEGHADEQGTRLYNINLGERRANAVREFLISRGIAPSRIQTISYGKERPLAVCSNESCYAQNRRAVSVITAGVGA